MRPLHLFSHKEKDGAFFACPTVLFTPQKNEFFPLIDPDDSHLFAKSCNGECTPFIFDSVDQCLSPTFFPIC